MLMRIATIPKEEWIAREPLKDFGRHMGRLALIAPREVVEPATKFQTKVAKVLIELGRMRQRLDTLDAEIEADERRIAELVPLVKVLGEQVRDLMETDRIMSREFDVTSRREGETSAEFSDLRKEVEELRKQRAALGLVLAQRAMDAVLETREYSLPATIAARRDIGLTSDDAWFAALQEAETKEIAEMASRSFNEEEQLIRRTQPAQ
jgi:hypothetical protein